MSKKKRHYNPIDAIEDSIKRRKEIAAIQQSDRIKREVEFLHFKNVVSSRLGNDPVVAQVISTWRVGKEPAYCEVQIENAKEWSRQELTDIENLYASFKVINEHIWEAEKKYGSNPKVRALIDEVRRSSDVRAVAFDRMLQNIIGGDD